MSDPAELRERTRELALTVTRSSLALRNPPGLVELALRLDRERQGSPPESRYRRALAQTLLDIHDELERRMLELGAPNLDDSRGPLGLWADNPDSPLVGVLGDVAPFQFHDLWATEAITPQPQEPRPRIGRRRPHRRRQGVRGNTPDVAPTTARRVPGPTGIGRELGRENRSRPGEVVPGFMGELLDGLPDGTRQVGVPLVGLVLRFVAPLSNFALGGLNAAISLFDALDSANRTQTRENRKLGVRMGLAACLYLTPAQLRRRRISAATLINIIQRNGSLARMRERQRTFAGSSGPGLVARAINDGIAAAARTVNAVIERAEPDILAELGDVSPGQRVEVRRQIIDALIDEVAEGLQSTD